MAAGTLTPLFAATHQGASLALGVLLSAGASVPEAARVVCPTSLPYDRMETEWRSEQDTTLRTIPAATPLLHVAVQMRHLECVQVLAESFLELEVWYIFLLGCRRERG